MKVLVADKLADAGLQLLKESGQDVIEVPKVSGDALVGALMEHDPRALVVRSTKVPREALEAATQLELVVRAGAGYDNIDVEAASERGVFVANCPGKNSAAVAELTLGLVLALDRYIPDNVVDAREGRWNKARYSKAEGVKGKTLGVIGLGNIGMEVVRRARSFGMQMTAWSRSLDEARASELQVERKASVREVAAASDFVTLHVAATPDTEHLADRSFFEAMKPGACFINTTRHSVVDEDALAWALDEKGIRAAIDVMAGEPSGKEGAFDHPLAGHPNVYITHHIGASTQQAQDETAAEAARIINVYHNTGSVPHCVNLADVTPATQLLTVRHLDKVGVLASVLDEVRKAHWNVQEMENLVFSGARAACARIRVDGDRSDEVVERIRSQEHVLAVSLIDL